VHRTCHGRSLTSVPGMDDDLELPKVGDTSLPAWRPTTTESPGTVTMAEAVELWQVSERTLRRRLGAGEIPGAHKVPTSKGEEWRIPATALDSLGYDRTAPPVEAPSGLPSDLGLGDLLQELRADRKAWRDLAKDSRLELAAAESDRVASHKKVVQLELELEAEKERLDAEKSRAEAEKARADALAVELAEALKPRRRWGRR